MWWSWEISVCDGESLTENTATNDDEPLLWRLVNEKFDTSHSLFIPRTTEIYERAKEEGISDNMRELAVDNYICFCGANAFSSDLWHLASPRCPIGVTCC